MTAPGLNTRAGLLRLDRPQDGSPPGLWIQQRQGGKPNPYRGWGLYVRGFYGTAWIDFAAVGNPQGTGVDNPVWIFQRPYGNDAYGGPFDAILDRTGAFRFLRPTDPDVGVTIGLFRLTEV